MPKHKIVFRFDADNPLLDHDCIQPETYFFFVRAEFGFAWARCARYSFIVVS